MNLTFNNLINWPGPDGYIDIMQAEGFAIPSLFCKIIARDDVRPESLNELQTYFVKLSRNYIWGRLTGGNQDDLRVPSAVSNYNDKENGGSFRHIVRRELELKKLEEIERLNINRKSWNFDPGNIDLFAGMAAEMFGFRQEKTLSCGLTDKFLGKNSYTFSLDDLYKFAFSYDSNFKRLPSSSPLRFYILDSSKENLYLHDLRNALPVTYEYSIFSWSEMRDGAVIAIHRSAESATLGIYALVCAFKILAQSIVNYGNSSVTISI
ncbi:MAG TPA: hypothetical protein VIN59_01805 [Alphaproteobacteria bacterium]